MIVRYSQEDSLSTALAKTFDGRHACKLCRIVQAGKSAEKAPAVEVKLPKFEACAPVSITVASTVRPATELPDIPVAVLQSRTTAPLVPPPRRA